MNLVDVVVLLVAAGAASTGWRHGFVGRALSWIGLTVGIAVGALFVDDLVHEMRDETSHARLFGALVFLVLVALVGQMLATSPGVPRTAGFPSA